MYLHSIKENRNFTHCYSMFGRDWVGQHRLEEPKEQGMPVGAVCDSFMGCIDEC